MRDERIVRQPIHVLHNSNPFCLRGIAPSTFKRASNTGFQFQFLEVRLIRARIQHVQKPDALVLSRIFVVIHFVNRLSNGFHLFFIVFAKQVVQQRARRVHAFIKKTVAIRGKVDFRHDADKFIDNVAQHVGLVLVIHFANLWQKVIT